MKFIYSALLSITCLFAQAQSKSYVSASGEMIFSFAKMEIAGKEESATIRWSPVFNGQGLVNHNTSDRFGLFYGLAYRNVGFIYKDAANVNHKYRTYNVGVPIGLKLGKVNDGTFLFGGYEFEIPLNYKEKEFVNDQKTKFNVWFTDRVNWYTQSVFLGLNFKGGASVKFKYYLDNFFNKNYTETVSGVTTKPYEKVNVNVFYFSIAWNVFGNVKGYKNMMSGGSAL